ncbi:hypothetical protein [Streptomyces tirandamycinicus]|uniref:Uncharacterized protein n=1 Tax=Streptomyces tirandamycinicus TaxID=2174846 RepID=A0A2S1T0U4_9ACTN|nr:hypothetical protein [Streptomyces tirandamycinicus]AWI32268.1 hypothetical protein DDW44_28355 [Streptomyces tirandamycinicus]
MRPESTNGTSGGGLAVPMAWLCAEFLADQVLRTGGLVEPGSLEYRAGRETLALTVYLCGAEDCPASVLTASRLDEWLSVTAYGHPWQEWVRDRMAERESVDLPGTDPDLELARASWGWLERTELLAADLGDDADPWHPALPVDPAACENAQVWTPAWRLGLPLGHLAVHLY